MNPTLQKNYRVFQQAPVDFAFECDVVANFLFCNDKILLLQYAKGDDSELLWGVPAGKKENHESIFTASVRELKEETSFENEVNWKGRLYIRKPECDYTYHIFEARLPEEVEPQLSSEHQAFRWVTLEEALSMDLTPAQEIALKKWHNNQLKPPRTNVVASAYLLLEKDGQLALGRRQNTGYQDGCFGLISGHVDEGESVRQALVREAKEEAGISIREEDLQFVHCGHRNSGRNNLDFYFRCSKWEGPLVNCEPEKCEGWQFFPIDHLPEQIMDYVGEVIRVLEVGQSYSENGWEGDACLIS